MKVTYDFDQEFDYEIDDLEAQNYLIKKYMLNEYDVEDMWERYKDEHLEEIKQAWEDEAYTMYLDTKLKDKDVYSYYGMGRNDFR